MLNKQIFEVQIANKKFWTDPNFFQTCTENVKENTKDIYVRTSLSALRLLKEVLWYYQLHRSNS